MVKKAAQAIPNALLRRARLERGWSQQVVADRIGAPNDMMITRWERGKAFPSPYYVERLCLLFEMRASDLGLLRESSTPVTSPAPRPPPGSSRHSRESDEQRAALASPPPSPLSHLPLVGREADVRALREIYQIVQRGQTQAVLLRGEAGIGKTHLASTFLYWAAEQGATLLQGRAFEMGGRLPYQPLVHVLGRCLEEEPAPEALLSATWLSELSRMLPELRDRYPSLPLVAGDETTARIRLFEAVTRLLQALSERSPVILFLDDVQWVDAASLDMLFYAGQRWSERGAALLLLLSLRSEALVTTTPLSQWRARLRTALPVADLRLGPLTQDATHHLLAALETGHARTVEQRDRLTDLGKWLFRETHGQPFYLVETLRVLLERQILTLHRSEEGEERELELASLSAAREQSVLAPNVRRLILSQLEQLTPMGRALVRSSAILGHGTSFEVLCRVADLPEEESLAALDEVLGHGLLREVSEADGRETRSSVEIYLFGHDKMREVIYAEMGEVQRRLLHRRAFAVCEQLRRPAAELAHHARASRLAEHALRFSLEAGDEAMCLLANAEASLHYTQALEALSQLPETADTPGLRVETILKLVPVSYMAVNLEHTLGWLTEAENLAQAFPDRRQLVRVHCWMAFIYCSRNAIRQTIEYAQHVLAEAREVGDEGLVGLASIQLGRGLLNLGDFGSMEGLLTPVIPALEQRERWLDWTYALGYLGMALAAGGQYAAGRALVHRAMEQARCAGNMESTHGNVCHNFLSFIYLLGGDPAQALSEGRQAVEGAQRVGEPVFAYMGYGLSGWALSRLGKHEEGMQYLERAQAIRQQLGGWMLFQNTFAAVTTELLLSAGRVEEALAGAEAVVERIQAEGGILSAGLAQRVWGQALARLARREEAEAHLAESWQILLSGKNVLEAARTQVAWGLLCLDRGETALARVHFLVAAAQFEASGLTSERETVQGYLAQMRPG
jgi:tetratricopeptide (TPR) repeat protein/transcriptional regulator with XRE-family HTH domain